MCCRNARGGTLHALATWMEYKLTPESEQWLVRGHSNVSSSLCFTSAFMHCNNTCKAACVQHMDTCYQTLPDPLQVQADVMQSSSPNVHLWKYITLYVDTTGMTG